MSAMKDVIVAGSTIFVKVALKREKAAPGEKRQSKQNVTPKEIDRVNQKNAEKTLAIIVNYNFAPRDLHLVLTYSGDEPTKEQAKKDLEKFKRDLMNLYRKKGLLLKWISCTEYENKRIHHHLICTGGVDISELTRIWKYGFIRPTYLDETGDYRKLASYLIKETSKTFREADAVSRRRYNCSRSIQKPQMKRESVSVANILKDPKPITGYYIDRDSIFRGKNPITGSMYLEYVMISLTVEPRVKSWSRGRRKKFTADLHKVERTKQLNMSGLIEEASLACAAESEARQ